MPIRHATLHQMKIFGILARQLSVTRTAEILHMTPPAVSIQIKQLAESSGQPLIEQVGKQLYLTDAGKIMAAACHDVFERMELLAQDLSAQQGVEKGILRLSIITTAKYFVPRLMGDFCAEHPGIDVSLFVGNRKAILERLANNEDDLYVLGQPPEKLRVVATPFAPNSLVAITSPDHPLAGKRAISPKKLANEPFIAREHGSGTRLAYEEFFNRHKTTLKIRMELGSNEAIKQAVAGRLGISVLSRSTLQAELASGELTLLDVKGLPIERKWYVAYPEGRHVTPAAAAFQDFLVAC